MNLEQILRLLTILQIITLSQNSHVQEARQRIRAEVRSAVGHLPPSYHHHHNQHHHHQQKYHGAHWHDGQRVHRWHNHHNRWSGRRSKSMERHHFTAWSAWSGCGSDCVKRRERYCKVKRKCGYTKHLEEHKCWGCHPAPVWHATNSHDAATAPQTIHHTSSNSPAIIINAPQNGPPQVLPTQAPLVYHHHHHTVEQIRLPVLQEIGWHPTQQHHHHQHANKDDHHEFGDDLREAEAEESSDFYVINEKPKERYKKKQSPVYIDVDDYAELEAEDNEDELDDDDDAELQDSAILQNKYAGHVRSIRTQKQHQQRRHKHRQNTSQQPKKVTSQRNLPAGDDGIEGDIFQYEDFDFDHDRSAADEEYGDSYDDSDYTDGDRNSSLIAAAAASSARERATPDGMIPKHRRIYSKWSRWTKCSPKCTTRRYKKCRIREQCGREVLREIAYCYTEGSFCQQWLQAQVQKSPPYELRPMAASRRRDISVDGSQTNSIVGSSDYIMHSKGYRGAEYTPLKLRCGIAPIRSNKRNMYNMLKIIGGKAARKGEWPWQVAIFNRFKEAFCGGTLIAPQWVLTAAHCVRKVLYVRLGEHNLDYEDGTELQLRVLKSFKHPNFDKKTVDSDVALLRLPKPVNTTTWIGFSCLPHPYQPLPKNMDCTVIGWGKRRNRDVAGTSVLHQAEVPMIPMDNCRSVYHDYTITKNMFCAGHKRGRIDTCAGDSGGPLLCRDTTKPNHPWTIFGITSFGDGCAKRNKFGIYAKVPNYVDWVWSVINCNGNCKLHQRNYGN